ncbi:MAG: hypothetical protein H0X46_05655 [Bacteroidetes bacterium]|nr:hypothetical protein [Bacteroidota bacterium]
MKKTIPLIIVLQTLSVTGLFSQTAVSQKPSSDACPSWSSKPVSDKADYFAYLSKRPKKQESTDFSTPKYHNFNAVPSSASQKRKATGTAENQQTVQTNTPAVIYGKRTEKEPVAETPAPGTANPAPIVAEHKQTPVTAVKEKIQAPKTVAEDKDDEFDSEDLSSVKEKGAAETTKEDKKQVDSPKRVKKHSAKHRIKKISFRRKSAAKCPQF